MVSSLFMRLFKIILVLFVICANIVNAQISVDFTSSPSAGCMPLNVVFTNTSSNIPNDATYFWEFGDGTTSTAQNPQTTYHSAGEFTVKLTITDSSDSYSTTKEAFIKVSAKPTAHFNYSDDLIGCVPFSATFNNASTDPQDKEMSYIWSFGDGEISTDENPEHIYTTAGVYNITLVTNNEHCQDSYTFEQAIEAVQPKAVFGVSKNQSCSGELTALFTNLSEARAGFTSLWDLGDGSTSEEKNPTHLYTQVGNYSVQLKVTDDLGCTNSIKYDNLIQITETVAKFSASTTAGCIRQKIKFTNESESASKYVWHFGDGTTSTAVHPEKTYTQPGNYQVKLIATNGSCSDEVTLNISIEEAIANFELSENYICELPTSISYINHSQGAVSYEWRFGNGQTSTEKSPTIEYSETTPLKNYQAQFSDTLIVTSANGCTSRYVKKNSVKINLPNVRMSPGKGGNATQLNGCVPMNLTFEDKSIYNSDVDRITSYQWRVDNGEPQSGSSTNITVSEAKKTTVRLTVTTEKGCISNAVEYINAGAKFNVDFERDGNYENCANTLISYTITSPEKKYITNEVWDFGDGSTPGLPTSSHYYEKTGRMDVSLTIYNNGCASKITKENFIKILGPYAYFEREKSCENPFEVHFNAHILDATEFSWDFGDGTPKVHNIEDPTHTYAETGNYTVTLTATNSSSGCSYTFFEDVYIRNLASNFDLPSEAPCLNNTLTLDGSKSVDTAPFSYNNKTVEYLWFLKEENKTISSLEPIQHKFTHQGINNISLIVKDVNGCADTLTQELFIHQPEPNFTANHELGCMPITFAFTNQTTSTSPIQQYEWDFGDGTLSNGVNPTHEYSAFGQYTVSLKVTDDKGCSNKISKKEMIQAVELKADFQANKNKICVDETATFSAKSQNEIVEYNWSFSNGETSTEAQPAIVFDAPGFYTVTLNLKDIHGCQATKTVNNYVDVQAPPVADFTADVTQANCYPLIVQFKNKTETDNPGTWIWDFGQNRNKSRLEDPYFIYNRPGNHDVTLISRTTYGCSDTIVKKAYIQIDGPYAEFQLPDSACLETPISFDAVNLEKVYDMRWDFGDGHGQEGNNRTHNYTTAATSTQCYL